jgi:hypothetical protein
MTYSGTVDPQVSSARSSRIAPAVCAYVTQEPQVPGQSILLHKLPVPWLTERPRPLPMLP